ncbi:MAG: cytochrome c biogenesis protein ResB [Planctomycetota bacterium]
MKAVRSICNQIGSLWLAAVLLMLLLVSMACATAYESEHGTSRALITFYGAWWFEALLALVGINAATNLVARSAFSKRMIGFTLTHLSILVILLGSLVTQQYGIDAQVRLAEGDTTTQMVDSYVEAVTMVRLSDNATTSMDLPRSITESYRLIEEPWSEVRHHEGLQVKVARYLPDSTQRREITASDNPRLPPAVEIELTTTDKNESGWVFPGQFIGVGPLKVVYRQESDQDTFNQLTGQAPAPEEDFAAYVEVLCRGTMHRLPLRDCLRKATPLGQSGYSINVLRHLPYAIVGENSQIINDPTRQANPAIEVEIVGAGVTERRVAFARFPGFRHGQHTIADVEVTFVTDSASTPQAPVEVISGPDRQLYVRFSMGGSILQTSAAVVGETVNTPWPQFTFTIRQQFEHAEANWLVEEVAPPRDQRVPALLLDITNGTQQSSLWLQKNRTRRIGGHGAEYQLSYTNKLLPLGFALTLERFQIHYYPGGQYPRRFESLLKLSNPETGQMRSAVVTMNAPVIHNGYSFYQSGYDLFDDANVSHLSVSRDPGRAIVYTGYCLLMFGMLVVLVTRVATRLTQRKGTPA